ncbi:MAG TPA: small ribosomal subunit Rsm22 family protein [Candidatus Angelobacter sp.]
MQLRRELLAVIEQETARFERAQLARATAELTERYKREGPGSPAIGSEVHRAAYLAVRLPATYAAACHVFRQVHAVASQLEIKSMLDLGAGPGTALLAARAVFPALERATLLEADVGWLKTGRLLTATLAVETQWLQHDLRAPGDLAPHDLVVISYALGELPQAAGESLLRRAWQCATKLLVIVEPGTMRGFAGINAARSWLLANGANLVGPCPHENACPMAAAGGISGPPGRGDWCHFAQRVERSSLHRSLKGGSLGHEDEKFSYVAAAREPVALPQARIVRHPGRHSGHIQLTLCTAEGIAMRTIAKSRKQTYKEARKADWGDAWND